MAGKFALPSTGWNINPLEIGQANALFNFDWRISSGRQEAPPCDGHANFV
jgi:hypothetical protein